ncbi:MAG: hypothetical protein LBP55_09655 [Candidatus Adiutrix sp.]|jgi:hypothetical protein|nr:hypothetical protein [Candidatus Adiutrix sp.]
MKNSGRQAARSPHTRKQQDILKGLALAASRLGWRVSAGQLRFADLKLKGGNCRLRDSQWLILDKGQPFDDLLDIYRQVLSAEDLKSSGLPAELQEQLLPYLNQPGPTDHQAA